MVGLEWSAFSLGIPESIHLILVCVFVFFFFRPFGQQQSTFAFIIVCMRVMLYGALGVCDNTQYTCYSVLFCFCLLHICSVEAMQPRGSNAIFVPAFCRFENTIYNSSTDVISTQQKRKMPLSSSVFFVVICAFYSLSIEDWCSCQQNQFHQQMLTSNSCMSREFHRYDTRRRQ